MKKSSVLGLAAVMAAAFAWKGLCAETVRVVDCVRDPSLDVWTASDVRYAHAIMTEVFKRAGIVPEWTTPGTRASTPENEADVICSAFRTPELLEKYDFPLQPMNKMRFALYADPKRAKEMIATKLTDWDWPNMKVGYSPVAQGQSDDRTRYFDHARLSPGGYVEFSTSAGAVQALLGGDIDALFLYTTGTCIPDRLAQIVPIGTRNAYFAVKKGKPELLAALVKAYRDFYIDDIEKIDALREKHLMLPKPAKRVRVAAYSRGDIFRVSPDGVHSGSLEKWLNTVASSTRWDLDYVYGGFDESIEDVKRGRLDLIGGLKFDASRREQMLFSRTPIGMLRLYLWTHKGNPYKPGDPTSWRGMKVGLLAGSLGAAGMKRQHDAETLGIEYREYASDKEMLSAYFRGEVDACVDVEMPEFADEVALHLYSSHPMFICVAKDRQDLFDGLEKALHETSDDLAKYVRLISEHHYGTRSEMAALTLKETEWLNKWRASGEPVYIDFSPWPFNIRDKSGKALELALMLQAEVKRRTGLVLQPQEQTELQTAEAKFMRGETMFWIPYPAKPSADATFGATSVFSIPVPATVAEFYGVKSGVLEFEMFANPSAPPELVSIIAKAVTGIDAARLQEMFMSAAAERKVVHKVFGLTGAQLLKVLAGIFVVILLIVAIYSAYMARLLRREAAVAEEHAMAKTRFLAMMSHELRTPLNAVIGFAEFLARPDVDNDRRGEYTAGILTSANALLDLINDILDLSKLEAGATDMRSGECDVKKLLDELPAIFGYRVRRHGVGLSVSIEGGANAIPVVSLSQQGLRQILINLVGNAAKFTKAGTISIKAAWRSDSNTLHIEVADTGCGISDEKLSKLFDPFVQDIASRMERTEKDAKGTGLGLPIVKRMVDNARGTVIARSKLGKGTEFIIDIPNLDVVRRAAVSAKSAAAVSTSAPRRVLIVDDIETNRRILGIHLRNLGVAETRGAENGEEALAVMDDWMPDLVLTDMWMPKMDGAQLVAAMRGNSRLSRIPVVAVTADVDVGSTFDIRLFAKVIAKPVTTMKLQRLFGEI